MEIVVETKLKSSGNTIRNGLAILWEDLLVELSLLAHLADAKLDPLDISISVKKFLVRFVSQASSALSGSLPLPLFHLDSSADIVASIERYFADK